ncbi:MAG TPA: FkbM family methyltransferase [Candidatus Sulfotelmatobacter sp.]|nr:FkbM family methyltransferase [Candidatus Sulfotelmatobacter sp.]
MSGARAEIDWDGRLARLYAALAEHQRRDEPRDAEALQEEIAAVLAEAIRTTYDLGCAHRAAGRDRAAVQELATALDLHRWAPPGFVPPVGLAACYRALGELYQAWGQPLAAAAAAILAVRGGQSFYRQPHLCQIPVLGALYEQLFGRRADGCFVEVGAFDGETYGNTAGLADLGWRGLYVEPVPASFQQCLRRHAANPRVTVLNCAIGDSDGTAALWVAREFSTTVRGHIDHGIAEGWMPPADYERIEVPQLRLASALTQAAIAPGFDLLVVDVEGAEEPLFGAFDLGHWRPHVLIVELPGVPPSGRPPAEPVSPAAAAAHRVRALIEASGYETVYADYTNTVFRRLAA